MLLWNLEEAARQLGGVSPRTVRRLLERGELPTVRIGTRLLIPAESVRDWIDRQPAYSSPIRPLIPTAFGHPFQHHSAADSSGIRPSVPTPFGR